MLTPTAVIPGTADPWQGWLVRISLFLCSLVNGCYLTRIRALEVITQKHRAFKTPKQYVGCKSITSEVGHIPARVFCKALMQSLCVCAPHHSLCLQTHAASVRCSLTLCWNEWHTLNEPLLNISLQLYCLVWSLVLYAAGYTNLLLGMELFISLA